jgi:hypothetical protein
MMRSQCMAYILEHEAARSDGEIITEMWRLWRAPPRASRRRAYRSARVSRALTVQITDCHVPVSLLTRRAVGREKCTRQRFPRKCSDFLQRRPFMMHIMRDGTGGHRRGPSCRNNQRRRLHRCVSGHSARMSMAEAARRPHATAPHCPCRPRSLPAHWHVESSGRRGRRRNFLRISAKMVRCMT